MEALIEYVLLLMGYLLVLIGLAMTIVGFVRKRRRWRLIGFGLVFFGGAAARASSECGLLAYRWLLGFWWSMGRSLTALRILRE